MDLVLDRPPVAEGQEVEDFELIPQACLHCPALGDLTPWQSGRPIAPGVFMFEWLIDFSALVGHARVRYGEQGFSTMFTLTNSIHVEPDDVYNLRLYTKGAR